MRRQRWLLVTSSGWVQRGAVDQQLVTSLGRPRLSTRCPRTRVSRTSRPFVQRYRGIWISLWHSVAEASLMRQKASAASPWPSNGGNGESSRLVCAMAPPRHCRPRRAAALWRQFRITSRSRWIRKMKNGPPFWGDGLAVRFRCSNTGGFYPSVAVLDPALHHPCPRRRSSAGRLPRARFRTAMEGGLEIRKPTCRFRDRMASTATLGRCLPACSGRLSNRANVAAGRCMSKYASLVSRTSAVVLDANGASAPLRSGVSVYR